MKPLAAAAPPQLAAPGAGLPMFELWIAKMIFRRAQRKLDPRQASALIVTERAALLEITRGLSAVKGSRRVLIKRPRGLEDSSRFWSVYMTLEHLRIVNEAIAQTMRELSAGKVPPGEASTAAVKPAADIGIEAVASFTASCAALIEAERGIQDTPARYPHPWFGPLDTHGWHVMAGFHMRLHRGQIEAILRGLDE